MISSAQRIESAMAQIVAGSLSDVFLKSTDGQHQQTSAGHNRRSVAPV
jgi:hypothetical protein